MGGDRRVKMLGVLVAVAVASVFVSLLTGWLARHAAAAGWTPRDVLELAAGVAAAGAVLLVALCGWWWSRDRRRPRRGGYVRIR